MERKLYYLIKYLVGSDRIYRSDNLQLYLRLSVFCDKCQVALYLLFAWCKPCFWQFFRSEVSFYIYSFMLFNILSWFYKINNRPHAATKCLLWRKNIQWNMISHDTIIYKRNLFLYRSSRSKTYLILHKINVSLWNNDASWHKYILVQKQVYQKIQGKFMTKSAFIPEKCFISSLSYFQRNILNLISATLLLNDNN